MKQIKQVVKIIKEKGLYPEVKTVCSASEPEVIIGGKKYLMFCSNNYLGLSTNKNVVNAAIKALKKYGLSPCSSRLIAGNNDINEQLEKKIAEFHKTEAAIIYSVGFVSNTGTISAIFDGISRWSKVVNIDVESSKGLVISDALNHASIIDGCRLSNVETAIYKHNNLTELEEILKKNRNRRKLIVTDSVFSMDGDIAPLPEIVHLAKKYNSLLMIDEAHGIGVFGKNGTGVAEHFGVEKEIDIRMGTLSKALGGMGGFVTGSKDLIDFLRISARPYIFTSTSSPIPAVNNGVYAAIEEIEKHPELRKKLWDNSNYLRNGFKNLGFDVMNSECQIIPILVGDEKKAIKMAKLLFKEGIFALCVRYTAVPLGKARIRFTTMASHTRKQMDFLLNVVEKIGNELKVI